MTQLLPGSAQRLELNHHQPALCINQQMCQFYFFFVRMIQMFGSKLVKVWINCTVQTYVKFRNLELARDFLGLQAQFLLVLYSLMLLHFPLSYQALSGSILNIAGFYPQY